VRPLSTNRADAEDIAQEIIIRALRGVDALASDDEALVCSWLDTLARNTAYNENRGRKHHADREPVESDMPKVLSAEREALGRLSVERLVQAIAALPTQLREVLQLRVLEELPGGEVAERLGITETAVRSRLHRARAALREATQSGSTG